jgi:RNA polymerase sigma-70 factor, ECF subfamily
LGYEGSCGVVPELQQGEPLPVNMTDVELDHLFASCMPRLRQAARHMLRNPQDCEDALQEGLLLAVRNLNQFQGRSKFSTWLHSIVRNAARTQVRKTKCRPQCSWEDLSDLGESTVERLTVDPRLSPADECALREKSGILLQSIQDLPSRYQAALRLCDVDGVDSKEAARRLGITACGLKTYLFRARRFITKRIRLKYVLRRDRFPGHEHPGLRQTPAWESSRQVHRVGAAKHSEGNRYRMSARRVKRQTL